MKIQELLNVEKALAEKKQELVALRKEAEELQMMIDINMKKDDTIDIHDVYVVTYENIHYFCYKKEEVGNVYTWVEFYNIFNGREITYTSKDNYLKFNGRFVFQAYPIREVFPELNVYSDEQVPRLLLQKLYYQANGIDAKTLQKTLTMGNEE